MSDGRDEVQRILVAECDSLERENARLRELLRQERLLHGETRRKLEKADHDRKRYAKRIRFMDGRHSIMCAHLRASQLENKILDGCVTKLERRLFDGTCGEAADGTPPASGEQEKNG